MPIPPGDVGQRQFLSGIDDNLRQKHRNELFNVKRDHLVDVTHR